MAIMELSDRTKGQLEKCSLFFTHTLKHIAIPSKTGFKIANHSKDTYALYFWKYTQVKMQEKSWRIYPQTQPELH